jgi:proline iminopeptidase
VFLGRASDIDWFFQGAAQRLPDAWQTLADPARAKTGADALQWLHAGLHGPDGAMALACALAWEAWEQSLSQQRAVASRTLASSDTEADLLVDKYRIQSHYLVHQCFRHGAGLLTHAGRLTGLPTAILHGSLDWICRPDAAWELHHKLPGSRLQWVDGCGHTPFEPGNAAALVACIQHFANHGNFSDWGADIAQAPNL